MVWTAAVCAQEATAVGPQRVHILGASVSGGFVDGPLFGAEKQSESVSLHRLLKAWCSGEAKVTTHPPVEMWALFRDPQKIGEKQIKLAKRRGAEAVVAVDFLFWFAYGYAFSEPEVRRPARFERGLALLDELKVPVIVGDLPDMRGAAARILSPLQVPSPTMLKQLNARLSSWASQRDHVTVLPLSALVKELKDDGTVLPLAAGPQRTPPKALLQGDGLHATRLGMAFMAYRMQGALRGLFAAPHALRDNVWSFEQFVAAAGAEEELEDLTDRLRDGAGK